MYIQKILKKITAFSVTAFLSIAAFNAYALEVNTATVEQLDTIKGIGDKKAAAIIAERSAHGAFKNAQDLATRVKGIGDKSVNQLMQNGLTIDGSSMPLVASTSKKPPKASNAALNNSSNAKAAADFSAGQKSVTGADVAAKNTQTMQKNQGMSAYPKPASMNASKMVITPMGKPIVNKGAQTTSMNASATTTAISTGNAATPKMKPVAKVPAPATTPTQP